MTGTKSIISTKLSEDILKESKEIIEELITAAINDAVNKVEEQTKGKMAHFNNILNPLGKL